MLESQDKDIIKEILKNVLKLEIKDLKYDKIIQLDDISEYEFELIKVIITLSTQEEIEMYLKMVKRSKIKESIFCYWCTIYEEELFKLKEREEIETTINKVLISELSKKKFQQNIFLEIENNKTQILETGTEINFLEIIDYINEYRNKVNQYEKILKYFNDKNEDVLLIGLKMKRDKREKI